MAKKKTNRNKSFTRYYNKYSIRKHRSSKMSCSGYNTAVRPEFKLTKSTNSYDNCNNVNQLICRAPLPARFSGVVEV